MEPNNQQTALLVMDMQDSILANLPGAAGFVSNVAKAINAARKNNLAILYIRVGFRETMPEISMNNKGFAASRERFAKAGTDAFMKIHSEIEPQLNDIVITKRRVSAFTGSDLEVILRAQQIQHIVLTGIATSGVVLSTLREAADKDYRMTVLSDGCADADEEVHRVLTTKIFPRQADVMTVEEWSK